ncbi:MAG: phospho-sugar mutase, partial [Pseudolysinimonas sp.]
MALLDDARAWIAQDPDPVTRAELDAVVARVEAGDAVALADLTQRFSGRLEFGTAGLRGELGAGPMRMNRVLVAQAAAGLAGYLLGREASP